MLISYCFFHLEGKIALRYIAEYSHQCGSKYFRRCRVPAQPVNKQLQEEVVEHNAHAYQHCITKQLHAALQVAMRENNVFRQGKAQRETNGKRHDKSGNVRRYMHTQHIYRAVFIQYIVVTDEIKQDIENRIRAATCQVPESVLWYPPFKGFMKKVYDVEYNVPCST